jgi:hypothetical protein
MASPKTNSATLRVLENGALKTGIQRQRLIQIDLVHPDAKAAYPISFGAAESSSAVIWVRERIPTDGNHVSLRSCSGGSALACWTICE